MNNSPHKDTSVSAMAALRSATGLQALYQMNKNVQDDRGNTSERSQIANHGDLGNACAAYIVRYRF